jgi:sulfur-oxidizing protein SoxA
MKNLLVILLLAFSLPAIADSVKTAGESETTPEATLKAIQAHFAKEIPGVKGDDFVNGSLNFSQGSRDYNAFMTARMGDNFDPVPGYSETMAAGKKLWEKPFSNGKTFAECLSNGKGVAANYPMVDAATGKVVTFEGAMNKCLVDGGEKPLAYNDMKTMGALSVYAHKMSEGKRIKMEVKTDAEKDAFARGKAIFYGRVGDFEQACAHCHIQKVSKIARTEDLSPVIGQAAHWPTFRLDKATDGVGIITLQQRYFGCQKNTRVKDPIKPGSEASNDLQYFHTYLSNGLTMKPGVFRK